MIIKIGTDRFWVKASNIERWPEILSTLPPKITCKSKKDIARDCLHYKIDESGRIVNADEVYGLFGVERVKNSLTIVGCNLIKENEEGYELTEGAVKLSKEYKDRGQWEKTLAEQLLQYSLRVRTVVLALLNGGYLYFENGYMENFISSYINYNDTKYYIFSSKPEEVTINNLLNKYTSRVLGSFWKEELGIAEEEEIEVHGVGKEYPALGSIGTYLKIPMMLFDYLHWIKDDGEGKYIFDKQKVKEDISDKTYRSLIIEDSLNEIEVLKELIIMNSDARGFFPLEMVGTILKEKIDGDSQVSDERWIDHYFITGINEGKFKISDHEQGQPRHGRGLLGKKDHQLIKLEIVY